MDRSFSLRFQSGKRLSIALLAALVTLAACGDAISPTESMDPDAVARIMPSVTDARLRLTVGLLDGSMRQRMRTDILRLESALTANNVPEARVCVDDIGDALTNYRSSTGMQAQDASDVSAIELMLFAVAPVVRNARWDIRFRAK